jgi:hypothetical protein
MSGDAKMTKAKYDLQVTSNDVSMHSISTESSTKEQSKKRSKWARGPRRGPQKPLF